jgi:hypothetical protein
MHRTTIDSGLKYYPRILVNGHRFYPANGSTGTLAFAGTRVKVKVVLNNDRRKKPEICRVVYTRADGCVHHEVWQRV